MQRRDFFKFMGATGALLSGTPALASSHKSKVDPDNVVGVLTDFTECIGCRECEWACKNAHNMPTTDLESYKDKSVFTEYRRPDEHGYTVVNRFHELGCNETDLDVKVQCMHCNDPACVSACIVGALEKQDFGPVTYDPWKCIGCRYCMVACPFQIPSYEYDNALTPKVMKCDMCVTRLDEGKVPACVEICPRNALTFGKRSDLIELAHEKIRSNPDKYVNHVYGETELGGTSWMFISCEPFEDIKFPKLQEASVVTLPESIQHGIFKYFIPPAMFYGLLGMVMHLSKPKKDETEQESEEQKNEEVHHD